MLDFLFNFNHQIIPLLDTGSADITCTFFPNYTEFFTRKNKAFVNNTSFF